jgi:hypothetical protein
MQAILAWTVPFVIWLILRLWCCYRGRPFYFPYYTSAARNALAALKQELRKDSPDAFHVWTVIHTYLRQRFYLSGSVDSHQLRQILGTCGLDDETDGAFFIISTRSSSKPPSPRLDLLLRSMLNR